MQMPASKGWGEESWKDPSFYRLSTFKAKPFEDTREDKETEEYADEKVYFFNTVWLINATENTTQMAYGQYR